MLLAERYRVIRPLGSGGMATVYLAQDERLGRRVAIKQLHAEGPADMARRFEREAKLGASLNHPNIVAVFDTVTVDEGVLIVMEYVEGETLSQALADGALTVDRALEVICGVARGLEHAHANGIVHRDVKPANVLLGVGGTVKLVDLGIATAAEHTQITTAGTVLGTPSYMAPEQLEGGEIGPAADIYAFAAIAFEVLAGRRARVGRTPLEIAHRTATEPPPDLREAWPQAPARAAQVLKRGMARDPRARPPSPAALAHELELALADDRELGLADERERTAETAALPPASAAQAGSAWLRALPQPSVCGVFDRLGARAATAAHALRRDPGRLVGWLPVVAVLAVLGVALALVLSGGGDGRSDHRQRAGARSPAGEPAQAPTAPAQPDSTTAEDAGHGARLNAEGKQLIDRGRYGEAIPVLRRAVSSFAPGTSDLNYAYALFNLGQALRLAGRPGEAIPILERRLEIDNQREVVRRELDAARRAAASAGDPKGRGKNNRGDG